jgi:glutamine amidotransferase
MDALAETVAEVRELVGNEDAERCFLTLIVTDGELLVAYQGGKELHFSTHKTRCPEREACPHFSAECESPTQSGYVNHLLVSSEPLQGENVWRTMQEGEIVAVDHAMRLHQRPAA